MSLRSAASWRKIFTMAYDEALADRIRDLVDADPHVSEKKMFGGLAFLVAGNMAVAVSGRGGLMVRVDPEETEAVATEPHAGPFEMRGRPVDGWLRIDADGLRRSAELERWVERGVAYARSLPSKRSTAG